MAKLHFNLTIADHAIGFLDDKGEGYALPKGAKSELLLRYVLKDDVAVDRFPGKSDEQALTAIKAEQDARKATEDTLAKEKAHGAAATLSKLEYLRRFTQSERIAISNSTDPVVQDFQSLINAAEFISIIDPDTIAGTNFLESVKLLGKGRAAEILAV